MDDSHVMWELEILELEQLNMKVWASLSDAWKSMCMKQEEIKGQIMDFLT